MKRLALLLCACTTGPSVVALNLHLASGERPLADADQVVLTLDDAQGRALATERSSPTTMKLSLPPVPAGSGYRASLLGTFGGDEVARGRTCTFDVVDGMAAPSVSLYLGQVGRFAPTGTPATTRTGAVAFLADGGALLVGGDGGMGPLASTEQYAQSSGHFDAGPPLGAARAGSVSAPLGDGSILVIGGSTGFPSVEAYAAGKWTPVPTVIPSGLTGMAAAPLGDGSVLVCGGRVDPGAPLDNGWLIGAPAGQLMPASPLAFARAGHTMTPASTARDATLFVIGGLGATGPVADIEVYDPMTSSFSAFGLKLSQPRYGHTATLLLSGRILVAGGFDANGQPLASAEVLDPVARRMLSAEPLGDARADHSATLLQSGRVLVAGGTGADGNALASAEIFDPSLGAAGGFVPTQPLSTARTGQAVVELCDGTLLYAGGGPGAERYVSLP